MCMYTHAGYVQYMYDVDCMNSVIRQPTLRLGVKGSGSLMLRGKALSMRFLIWMQFGGMTSQNE